MNPEYQALVAKLDAFLAATSARRQADLACRAGCSSCCHAWLTLSPIESAELREAIASLPSAQRRAIAERGRRELEREARGEAEPRCALLDPEGRCGAYERRPLVCRSQGHALLYPPGFVPEAAVRARTSAGDITHCPLNFSTDPPRSADVLDAGRVDQMLALVNQRYALAQGLAADRRTAISQIAAEAGMLGCSQGQK
jgi:hypothetical protein